jgi:RNA polymerase sigma-70 factor (ECF subfamily)
LTVRKDDEMELALDLPARSRGRAAPAPAADCSDGELLQRIAAGDREAFDVLYGRFVRPVFSLALRRLGDRGRAEDATQETFASVWRSARSYKADRGPGAPWLYAVARNAIVDRTRQRNEPPTEVPDRPSDGPGPADEAEQSWLSFRVHTAVQGLPEHERTLLELAYWGGLSQSEIAEFLNIPLGTVKTRTRSALGRLADVLEEVR